VAEAEEKKRKQEAAAAEEQRRKEAAAAEEQRRKEAAAAEEQRRNEAAAAEEQKRKEAAAAEERKRKEAAAAEERKRKEAAAAEKQRARSALADDLSKTGDGEEGTAEKKSGVPGAVCELFIGKTVKSNTNFPNMVGDPVVTIGIRLTPNRTLKEVKVIKPSEYPEFDKQVERGIRKSGAFPPECPEDFIYLHYLKTR
jgi:flagellar biosynthesis GTPase FlhF